jgi:hypothetical protein
MSFGSIRVRLTARYRDVNDRVGSLRCRQLVRDASQLWSAKIQSGIQGVGCSNRPAPTNSSNDLASLLKLLQVACLHECPDGNLKSVWNHCCGP